jgi:hypothetical protein
MDSNEIIAMIGCLGIFTILAAQVWTVLMVMRNSPLMALVCLVVPCMLPYFVFSTWPDAKKPFFLWLAGIALALCAMLFGK